MHLKTLLFSLVLAAMQPATILATPPPTSPIRLPHLAEPSPAPSPAPTPVVDPITKLDPDLVFVIDSDVPIVVISSPAGIVTTTTEAGPVKIRGRFVDGSGKTEWRTFAGKFVVTVEPLSAGRCELLVIPQGGITAEGQIKRRRLDVAVKVPPPDPEPGPKPDPDPKPDPITPSKLVVVIVEETAEAAAGRGAYLSSPELIKLMNAKQHRFRIVDKNVVGPDGKPPTDIARFLVAANGKPLPQLFLVDERGKTRFAGDLPTKNVDDLNALITKWGG